MKTEIIFLNWQGIWELAATGKTEVCAVCGGAKSAKAKVCNNCVRTYRNAGKIVSEAVESYRLPIVSVENEWWQLQKECGVLDVGECSVELLGKKFSVLYPRFDQELIDLIVTHYKNWQICCQLVKAGFKNKVKRKDFSWYAGILRKNSSVLSKLTHQMVLAAINEIYPALIEQAETALHQEQEKTARVASMLVGRHIKYILSMSRAGYRIGEIIRSLHQNCGVFGFEHGMKQKILMAAIEHKIKNLKAANVVMDQIKQRIVWVSCPSQFSHPKQAIKLTQSEMQNNEVVKRLQPLTLVIAKDLGINMPLYEKSKNGLEFIGRCNPVLRNEILPESGQRTQTQSGKMR